MLAEGVAAADCEDIPDFLRRIADYKACPEPPSMVPRPPDVAKASAETACRHPTGGFRQNDAENNYAARCWVLKADACGRIDVRVNGCASVRGSKWPPRLRSVLSAATMTCSTLLVNDATINHFRDAQFFEWRFSGYSANSSDQILQAARRNVVRRHHGRARY